MNNTATSNPVGWFEIYVVDMERAKTFYQGVFGVQLEKLEVPIAADNKMDMWAFPGSESSYGAPGALVHMEGVTPNGKNSVLVYFSCDDCAEQAKRAAELGGKIEHDKFSIGEFGYVAIVCDSEGNILGLHSIK